MASTTEATQPAGGEATATTEVAHGEGHGAFPPFDSSTFPSQILWLAIAFGLLYLLMSRIALPRVASVLDARSDRLTSDIGEANRLKGESDAVAAAYEQALAEARNNASGIAQKARDAAKAEADAKRAEAEASGAAKLADAEAAIVAAKAKAMSGVGAIAADTADAIVKSFAVATATKSEIEQAVKAALAK
ncbi:F0F1 ATP synthase subunit B [Mesorhizobium loti]|uniref:ATP synthase subunit b n=1 Tax=Mesorhizobium loti R88b TaxID=935548 RepID=A0A6M7WXR5_RHILI|nr:F0F1 ATP synthase subunit B [Mesorhizobium loti]QKD04894.1 F0F1 ATP synthase subunit B [Mesorhizobium loti R88b]